MSLKITIQKNQINNEMRMLAVARQKFQIYGYSHLRIRNKIFNHKQSIINIVSAYQIITYDCCE